MGTRRRRVHGRLAVGAALAAGLASAGLSALPGAPPAPAAVIGFEPCADRKLATYEQIAEYFARLDAATERVRVFDIGPTAEGRRQILAVISSEGNLAQLARHKTIARRLALARGLRDDEAQALAREGRAVVWIDFGLHSSELAHAQAAPLLAWRVATQDSEEMRAIRENVLLVLVPNLNPDGTTMWATWYAKHVGTPYEGSAPPELYHRYVGHDNNRDWFMFNMPESRNVAKQLYAEWFPQIVYNQHQEAPFPARIFIPPFDDPMNPHIPPLVMRGIAAVGEAMGRRFAQEGKTGVVSRLGFDTWWNGGMRSAPSFHNMVGILTETAHRSPAPATYDPTSFPKAFDDGTPTLAPSTSYPSPYRGGTWRFRDSCEYMLTASLATLDIAARRRAEWLYDIYQMGRDAIKAGQRETYVVPVDQWDQGATAAMIEALHIGGIEIEQAIAPFRAGARQHGAGSFVVRGAQAFRPYLADLLSPQVYPERRRYPGGPPVRPYDITGWTLPLQMGVRVERYEEPLRVETRPLARPLQAPAVAVQASRGGYAIDPRANDAAKVVNRLLADGERVWRATTPLDAGGSASWPAGTFIVGGDDATRERLARALRGTWAGVVALDRAPSVRLRPLRLPRVGLYRAWGGNIDEGWTRWLLERMEFPFSVLRDADLKAPGLHEQFDVIVLPDASYESMLRGLETGTTLPEFAGGMTPVGVASLYAFVTAGGTLVALDTAAELPLTTFGLPVRESIRSGQQGEVYVPGTLVRLSLDTAHPIAYGMPAETTAFVAHAPLFDVGRRPSKAEAASGSSPAPPQDVDVVARYASADLLMSGWLMGEPALANRPAVLELRIERGRVVLLGFRVQHRGQTHATFKLLFNSLYLATLADEDVATAPDAASPN